MISIVNSNPTMEERRGQGRGNQEMISFSRAYVSRFGHLPSSSIFYLCQGLSYNKYSSLVVGRTSILSMGERGLMLILKMEVQQN